VLLSFNGLFLVHAGLFVNSSALLSREKLTNEFLPRFPLVLLICFYDQVCMFLCQCSVCGRVLLFIIMLPASPAKTILMH
jgi:hypothetical protein